MRDANDTTTSPTTGSAALPPLAADLLIGAEAICDELFGPHLKGEEREKALRKIYHALENGALPARKARGIWIASRSYLRAYAQPTPEEVRAQTEALLQARAAKRERAKEGKPARSATRPRHRRRKPRGQLAEGV
jgi:hypothetical protein